MAEIELNVFNARRLNDLFQQLKKTKRRLKAGKKRNSKKKSTGSLPQKIPELKLKSYICQLMINMTIIER